MKEKQILTLSNEDLSPSETWGYHNLNPTEELLNFIKNNFNLGEIKLSIQPRTDGTMKYFWVYIVSNDDIYVNVKRKDHTYLSKVSINLYSGDPDNINICLKQYLDYDGFEIDMGISYSFKIEKKSEFLTKTLNLNSNQINYINKLFDLSFEEIWGD